MHSPAGMLERMLSWSHVLDLFTTIQAEDEWQIMQALHSLKLFSNDPGRGDLWRAVESGRLVLSSFSRPLSTGALQSPLHGPPQLPLNALGAARRS